MSNELDKDGASANQHLEIETVTTGAQVIRWGRHQLALGFPEEVVKAWIQARVSPTAWLIPDVRQARGVVQWALEFPLYFALFLQGRLAQGEKITVLTHSHDWPDLVEYLELSLLGQSTTEMTGQGVAPAIAEMLGRERDFLALKRPDGSVARVTDFLAPIFFDADGTAELDGLRVRSHGNNVYSFFAADDRIEEHALLFDSEPQPPFVLPACQLQPVVPQTLEVMTVGTSNGFDPNGPCSGTVVQNHGRFLLIDSGPYVQTLLRHAGVSPEQVSAVCVTHAHEDHAVGLSALLEAGHRLQLLVTAETAAILQRKLAILNPGVSHPDTLLTDAFDVVTVAPGETVDLWGLALRFHHTFHSIPCVGVELTLRDGPQTHRVLVTGDNNSRENIDRAAQEGVLSPERYQQLCALYDWSGDLVIADAGGGAIHGHPRDFLDCPADRVVCVHTGQLSEDDQHCFTRAQPGQRFLLAAGAERSTPAEWSAGQRGLRNGLGELDDAWVETLLHAARPLSVSPGEVVVREGAATADLYVVLTGELAVWRATARPPRKLATIRAGEIFGEMATVHGALRSATVQAETPARLLRIPATVFRACVAQTGLRQSFPELWDKRALLDRVTVLDRASVTARNQLARYAERRPIEPGATLIREGSRSNTVFVLVAGRVQVYKGTDPLLQQGVPVILDPGALIGETAPFLKRARNASIVAVDACEVLAIRGADFKRIVQQSPQLFCRISAMVKARSAA